jgi:hypothetical protein
MKPLGKLVANRTLLHEGAGAASASANPARNCAASDANPATAAQQPSHPKAGVTGGRSWVNCRLKHLQSRGERSIIR